MTVPITHVAQCRTCEAANITASSIITSDATVLAERLAEHTLETGHDDWHLVNQVGAPA
jgi:hypothetical protein